MKEYEGIVEALRLNAEYRNAEDALTNASRAADAIEELTKSLRACGTDDGTVRCVDCHEKFVLGCSCSNTLMRKAADAIEELEEKVQAYAETLHAYENPWTMITSRPMTAEEREEYEYVLSDDEAIIYTCPLPDDGQEVLTASIYGTIRLDTFEDDPDYGCGFEENGDMDGIIAWMPLPKPPKGV